MRSLLIFCVGLVMAACAATTVKVRSVGMEPTIKVGDEVRLDKGYYSNREPRRFDVIAVQAPLVETTNGRVPVLILRVIGVGDETVEMKHGTVFINGNKLEEPYKPIFTDQDFGPLTIPHGEYLLLGDNRRNNEDSRSWKPGTFKMADIVAKVTDTIHN